MKKPTCINICLISGVGLMLISLAGCNSSPPAKPESRAQIEYIAHASFRITDKNGKSIILDPFNDRIWLGYSYPKNLSADAVLISHPHFDHDASYNVLGDPQVFRQPETFRIGEMSIAGFATEHSDADEIKANGQNASNTIWLVTIEGRRVLHLGDTRPLSAEELATIGAVDVIITHPVDLEELTRLKTSLSASIIIPMHYKLPKIAPGGGPGLDPISKWIENKADVTMLAKNSELISSLPPGIVIFQPDEDVVVWSDDIAAAQILFGSAIAALRADPPDWKTAKGLVHQGLETDPGNISFYRLRANIEDREGHSDLATKTLEEGLRKVMRLDWQTEYQIRNKLLTTYQEAGEVDKAKPHQEWIASSPVDYHELN